MNKYVDDEHGIVQCSKCKNKYYSSQWEWTKYPLQFECECETPKFRMNNSDELANDLGRI